MTGKSAAEIKGLFNEVSPTYDLLNRILSIGCDRRWREAAAREISPNPGDILLDLCGGTGDLALELAVQHAGCRVLLIDFAEEMLHLARRKMVQSHFQTSGNGPVPFSACADALALPLPDQSCAAVTVGFGIRNLEDARAGLVEAHRVLRQGGRLVILEFMRPQGLLAPLKRLALGSLVPLAVWFVARERVPAYRYLTRSIIEYLTTDEMVALMHEVGFGRITVRHQPLGFASVIGGMRP